MAWYDLSTVERFIQPICQDCHVLFKPGCKFWAVGNELAKRLCGWCGEHYGTVTYVYVDEPDLDIAPYARTDLGRHRD